MVERGIILLISPDTFVRFLWNALPDHYFSRRRFRKSVGDFKMLMLRNYWPRSRLLMQLTVLSSFVLRFVFQISRRFYPSLSWQCVRRVILNRTPREIYLSVCKNFIRFMSLFFFLFYAHLKRVQRLLEINNQLWN